MRSLDSRQLFCGLRWLLIPVSYGELFLGVSKIGVVLKLPTLSHRLSTFGC